MWRRTVGKGPQHSPKLLCHILPAIAEQAEYFIQYGWIMVTHTAAADFVAVHHHIELVGQNS